MALQRGQLVRAAALCRESLLSNREHRDSLGLAASLAACAALAVARGQPERSALLYGSAAARLIGNVDGHHRFPHDQVEQERYITILRAQLDEARFHAAWEAGRKPTLGKRLNWRCRSRMASLPTGTVMLLFTDIEGRTAFGARD